MPAGFAHGFCTLEPDTVVQYKVSSPYDPASERGIAWDDPTLAISWPLAGREPILSPRDRSHPRLEEFAGHFFRCENFELNLRVFPLYALTALCPPCVQTLLDTVAERLSANNCNVRGARAKECSASLAGFLLRNLNPSVRPSANSMKGAGPH